jgi:hypothetical protein
MIHPSLYLFAICFLKAVISLELTCPKEKPNGCSLNLYDSENNVNVFCQKGSGQVNQMILNFNYRVVVTRYFKIFSNCTIFSLILTNTKGIELESNILSGLNTKYPSLEV